MSELKFSCPHCSQHIACGPEWAGMQTKCPSCQNDIVIPKPPPAVAAPPQPQPPPPPKPQATALRVSAPGAHGGHAPSAPPPPPPPPSRTSAGVSTLSVARPAAPPPPQHEAVASGHAAGAGPSGGASVYPRDNPAVQWAGLVGAFIVTGVIIAMAVAWEPPKDTPYMRMMAMREAAERGAATPDEDEDENSGGLTNTPGAATAAAATPQWGLSIQSAQIPQAAASGNFDSRPFNPERAYLQRTPSGYLLTVRQGTGFQAEREIMIALPLKPGEPLDGQTWAIAPDTTPAPRIVKRWLQNSRQQTRMFTNGYAMKLEFDQTANNQIPARLFVSLPDDDKTFVAGTMTASFLVAGTAGQQQRRQ